jgi:membrane-bound lytic murein transglycosylase A
MSLKPLIWVIFFVSLGLCVRADVQHRLIPFSGLDGWQEDDHGAALVAFKETCRDMEGSEWPQICAVAAEKPNARLFFETFFYPVLIQSTKPALFTGYFEPELEGSLTFTRRFRHPIYGVPREVRFGGLWKSRRNIEEKQILKGRGLELAWVENLADVFFLQIQGSGRVRLQNGSIIRLGYGGANGHSYRSIAKDLVEREVLLEHEVSANRIRDWVHDHPKLGQKVLWNNPAYVFFRRIDQVPAHKGPLGAMNRSLTTLRTLAVDPRFVTLGTPIWLEKGGPRPLNRLMIAQDTGSAIKGAQRADVFFGTGSRAGIAAGLTMDPGRMVVLMPIQDALSKILGQ